MDVGCWMVGMRVWGLCKAGRCWGPFVYRQPCRLVRDDPTWLVLSNQFHSNKYIEASLYGAGLWCWVSWLWWLLINLRRIAPIPSA